MTMKSSSNPYVIPVTSRGCFGVGLCWDLCMFQTIIYISREYHVCKNNKNNLFSTVSSWFDLSVTFRWPYHVLGITPLWNQTPTDVTMYLGCVPTELLEVLCQYSILSWFDLGVTLRWPCHYLGMTPLWNQTPTHVTMCTWLVFWPIYMTHFYTTLSKVQRVPYFDDHWWPCPCIENLQTTWK